MVGETTPQRIMETGYRFLESKALLSAVELGLFTELAGQSLSRETLQERLDIHPDVSADFLDTLVVSGFLEREDGRYRNAPDAEQYLDRNKETYVGDALEWASYQLYPAWTNFTEALRTGEPQLDVDEGEGYFRALYEDEERRERYVRSMKGFSLGAAKLISDFFEWDEYETMCDLGAAEGLVPVSVVENNPHVDATAFDLPDLEPIATEFISERGASDRVSFHGGDFLEDPIPEHDVFVLGRVLHHFEQSEKKRLLQRVYDALPDGGSLIVYGSMIDDDRRENIMALLVSLNKFLERETRYDYTPEACEGWMQAVGFSETTVYDVPMPETMVIGEK